MAPVLLGAAGELWQCPGHLRPTWDHVDPKHSSDSTANSSGRFAENSLVTPFGATLGYTLFPEVLTLLLVQKHNPMPEFESLLCLGHRGRQRGAVTGQGLGFPPDMRVIAPRDSVTSGQRGLRAKVLGRAAAPLPAPLLWLCFSGEAEGRRTCTFPELSGWDRLSLDLCPQAVLRLRFWMVVKEDGHMITARQEPRLVLVSVTSENGSLVLRAPGMDQLLLPCKLPSSNRLHDCRLFGLDIKGRDCGNEVAQWFTSFLKSEAYRLVQFETGMKGRTSKEIFPKVKDFRYQQPFPCEEEEEEEKEAEEEEEETEEEEEETEEEEEETEEEEEETEEEEEETEEEEEETEEEEEETEEEEEETEEEEEETEEEEEETEEEEEETEEEEEETEEEEEETEEEEEETEEEEEETEEEEEETEEEEEETEEEEEETEEEEEETEEEEEETEEEEEETEEEEEETEEEEEETEEEEEETEEEEEETEEEEEEQEARCCAWQSETGQRRQGERSQPRASPGPAVDSVDSGGSPVPYPDASPVLLQTEASLVDLNTRLEKKVKMEYFRPNIVVSGCDAFEEDSWEDLVIGDVELKRVLSCPRCILTTVDPDTGIIDRKEPLQTLKSYRLCDPSVKHLYQSSPLFGVYFTVEKIGVLRVGDPVYKLVD
ncbi:MOSC domain-containing protein 2, mitochondrial [Fukomys damarensis]|uniref:Mitochondrial amidoxime reducing component 2 n=1 Tax=Fukomys damarensis TaxID=885580 RepID=A0A091DRF7_FUKDA|nr:MOSC domain-containing protein 2, mitochondrial [Fukomys damarensis]